MAWLLIFGVSAVLWVILELVIRLKAAMWNDDGIWGPEHRDYSGHK